MKSARLEDVIGGTLPSILVESLFRRVSPSSAVAPGEAGSEEERSLLSTTSTPQQHIRRLFNNGFVARQDRQHQRLSPPPILRQDLQDPSRSPLPLPSFHATPTQSAAVMEILPPEVVPSAEEPHVHTIFETSTGTWQWVVADPATKEAVIIDPVLDEKPSANGISTTSADSILELVRHYQYRCIRILETHTERPQKTSSWYLRTQLRDDKGQMPRICTGKSITGVQRMFARQYRLSPEWSRHFESAFRDGQIFHIGHLSCHVLQLRPDCFAFVIGHNVFIGEVPQESSMRRLAGYTTGFYWHPGGGDSSRPTTSATTASDWPTPRPSISAGPQQPYSPLGSANSKRPNQTPTRPASHIHEMA